LGRFLAKSDESVRKEFLLSSTFASSPNIPIKVLLADDAQVMRRAIRLLLESHSQVELVGEATDFAQTIQMAKDLKPHVIVMDLYMPRDRNLDVKSHLNGGSQLLAMSISNDDEAKLLAESFGAAVLLDKTDLYATLVPAIIRSVTPEQGHHR
jgi:two-component system response regulator NreC